MTRKSLKVPAVAEQTPQWAAGLSHREQRFVEEYLIDLNGKEAAIRAGLGKTPKSAGEIASRMRRKGIVAAAISALMNERTGTTASRVIEELAKLAFSKITDIVRVEDGRVVVLDTGKLGDDQQAAISEIYETVGENGRTIKVKLHDKLTALDRLAKILVMYKERPTEPPKPPFDQAGYEDSKSRLFEMIDKMAARAAAEDNKPLLVEIQPPVKLVGQQRRPPD